MIFYGDMKGEGNLSFDEFYAVMTGGQTPPPDYVVKQPEVPWVPILQRK